MISTRYHQPLAAKDFSKKTLRCLENKGIYVISAMYIGGDCFYALDNKGQQQVRTFEQVLTLSHK